MLTNGWLSVCRNGKWNPRDMRGNDESESGENDRRRSVRCQTREHEELGERLGMATNTQHEYLDPKEANATFPLPISHHRRGP